MTRTEGALAILLLVGLGEAAALAAREATSPRAALPLLLPGDNPGDLYAPGGASRVLVGRTVAIGDYATVEDLARGALLAANGELDGTPPLSAGERARLGELARRADDHRQELLRTEAELAAAERELDAAALTILASLDPAQRAWILEHRNETSVGRVEAEYWADLLAATAASP